MLELNDVCVLTGNISNTGISVMVLLQIHSSWINKKSYAEIATEVTEINDDWIFYSSI